MSKKDYTLDYLLDLDGEIAEIGDGYWVKFSVHRVKDEDTRRPHGIKYSLTLHNEQGERVLGYDNAHSPYENKKAAFFDHIHKGARTKEYSYSNAEKLIEDFWSDVNKYLER
ncbi:MAG: hypothetical protein FJX18_07385 [Alphaproteobacteria bacterium]|nr:hypothetical protein [Alphaproteobacteria bacterium]